MIINISTCRERSDTYGAHALSILRNDISPYANPFNAVENSNILGGVGVELSMIRKELARRLFGR